MIYNIENNPETAKLLQQTMPPNTKDFGWFLATVEEAISKKTAGGTQFQQWKPRIRENVKCNR